MIKHCHHNPVSDIANTSWRVLKPQNTRGELWGAGKEDGSVAMEQLCLLLRLAAHVVADPGEGETPMIPLPMAYASQASLAAGQVQVYSDYIAEMHVTYFA